MVTPAQDAAEVTSMISVADRPLPGELSAAAGKVASLLESAAPLGVAFSGGVDSSVLLALAVRALGAGHVVAILGVSPSLGSDERLAAHDVAAFIGARIVEVRTKEMDNQAYRANGPDRCFHCKDELFTRISDEVSDSYGLAAVAYGENADDTLRPDRPGSRAAGTHKVLRPLAEAGLGKATVRAIARALQLPSADKPAAPCLASRIPHFQEVSEAKLGQIEKAEKALRTLGFAESRVRHHGEVARIELPPGDIVRAVSAPAREQIHTLVTAAGFRFVAVDVLGIQSGAFTLSLRPAGRD
jgi:pyridinium-3,5-biscarboxylic acid mononucleotide sulfurtransferase